MNLAYRFPNIFWNTACLIADSGGTEETSMTGKTSNDYDKIATAINKIRQETDIDISLVDINKSDYTFVPDHKRNKVIFGLKGISRINPEIITKIKAGRPYTSFDDFLERCPLNKLVVINLIKSGAFDELTEDRIETMKYYITKISDLKKKLTLQNFAVLVKNNLIPKDLNFVIEVFGFNKYIKSKKYILDNISLSFLENKLPECYELIEMKNNKPTIEEKAWKKQYDKIMKTAKDYISDNQSELLSKLNNNIFLEEWNKYAAGSISHWEMEALTFYYHEHELANINRHKYGIKTLDEIRTEEIDYYFKLGDRQIPIYKIHRIAGTVIK